LFKQLKIIAGFTLFFPLAFAQVSNDSKLRFDMDQNGGGQLVYSADDPSMSWTYNLSFYPDGYFAHNHRVLVFQKGTSGRVLIIRNGTKIFTNPHPPLGMSVHPRSGKFTIQYSVIDRNSVEHWISIYSFSGDIIKEFKLSSSAATAISQTHPNQTMKPYKFSTDGNKLFTGPCEITPGKSIDIIQITTTDRSTLNIDGSATFIDSSLTNNTIITLTLQGRILAFSKNQELLWRAKPSRGGYFSLKVSDTGTFVLANWGIGCYDIYSENGDQVMSLDSENLTSESAQVFRFNEFVQQVDPSFATSNSSKLLQKAFWRLRPNLFGDTLVLSEDNLVPGERTGRYGYVIDLTNPTQNIKVWSTMNADGRNFQEWYHPVTGSPLHEAHDLSSFLTN